MSYGDLEKAYRIERSNPTLQRLPDNFYEEGRRLLNSQGVGEYAKDVRECLDGIYLQRANKIIHYAGRADSRTKPPDNMSPEEAPLYWRIVEAVAENRLTVLDKPVEHRAETQTPMMKVRLKLALPAIIGSDSKEYGPFKEEDIAELPAESAKLLIERDVAEKA